MITGAEKCADPAIHGGHEWGNDGVACKRCGVLRPPEQMKCSHIDAYNGWCRRCGFDLISPEQRAERLESIKPVPEHVPSQQAGAERIEDELKTFLQASALSGGAMVMKRTKWNELLAFVGLKFFKAWISGYYQGRRDIKAEIVMRLNVYKSETIGVDKLIKEILIK